MMPIATMRLRGAGAGGAPTSDSLLHLHFDGYQGSPTALDSSGNGRTVTLMGRTCISTAQVLLDGAAAYFVGTTPASNHCKVNYFSALSTGSGDFTYRFKMRRKTGAPSNGGLFSRRNSAVYCPIELQCAGTSVVVLVGNSGLTGFAHTHDFSVSLAADTTYDMELEKSGTTLRLKVDGVGSGNPLTSFTGIPTSTDDLYIGAGGDGSFKGWIEEFEFFDYALHGGANFTPPTAPTAGTADPLTLPGATGSHYYWRFKSTQGGYLSIKEIEFRATATGSTTIDQTNTGGTPICDSNYPGLPASAAFNGSFTTADRWASNASNPAWLGYTKGSPFACKELALGDGGSGQDAQFGTVDYSDDGSAWTTYVVIPEVASWTSNTFQCFAVP